MHLRTQSLINICQVCRKEFHPFRKEAKYCSNICNGAAYKRGKIVQCAYCNKETYKKNKWFGVTRLFYCSKECKDLDSKYTNAKKELQFQARWAVISRIKKGEIKRMNCEICNKPSGHAHHYLGYEKEHWLDVKWLCRSHHSLEHQSHVRRKHV